MRDGDIFIINVDGTGLRQVTNNNAFEFVPGFSPDGNMIAFSRFVIDPGQTQGDDEIFTIDLTTGEERRLTDNAASDRFTDFSPDGRQIVFESNRDGESEIFLMNVDGTNQRALTDNIVDDFIPTFSPDGTLVAFARDVDPGAGFGTAIFTINVNTGEERQVSQGVRGAFDPNFGTLAARPAPTPIVNPQPQPQPQPPQQTQPAKAKLDVRVNSPAKVRVGDRFAYTIRVSNRGPGRAEDVVLTSRLPRSVKFVSAPRGCTFARGSRTLTCKLGDLPAGASRNLRIVVKAEKPGSVRLQGCAAKSRTAAPASTHSTSGEATV